MIRFFIGMLLFLVACTSGSQTINTSLAYSVNLPSKKTNKTPVLIVLHGYGSNEMDFFDMLKTFDNRFISFSLRAPIAIKGGGFCWYDMDFLPDHTFKYDYNQVKESKKKILSFISNACKIYNVDSNQVFLMGFSQGAIISFELALSVPTKIKGVLALSGRMLDESRVLNTDWTKAQKVKFFIAHGYSDNVIKYDEAVKATEFLKEKKISDLNLKSYEMPHTITGAELNDIRAWLVKSITPEKKAETKSK